MVSYALDIHQDSETHTLWEEKMDISNTWDEVLLLEGWDPWQC